jgi:hypothetical protein
MDRRIFMAAAAAALVGALPVEAKSGREFLGSAEITGATSWKVDGVQGRSSYAVREEGGRQYVDVYGDPGVRGRVRTTIRYT